MVLSEIIIDSFVLLAAIFFVIIVVSYLIYKLRAKKKNNPYLQKSYMKFNDNEISQAHQLTNFQFADNNYNMNYNSFNDSLNSNNKYEFNSSTTQFNFRDNSDSIQLKKKNNHFHKSNHSIKKISYK